MYEVNAHRASSELGSSQQHAVAHTLVLMKGQAQNHTGPSSATKPWSSPGGEGALPRSPVKPASDAITHSPQQRTETLVKPWQRGRLAQVAQHAVRAAKAGEHHRVDALPRECAVAHAVQPLGGPHPRVTTREAW